MLDLTEAVIALSDALDLVGVNDVRHGKRVAYMAEQLGRQMELPQTDQDDLFLAALLHDCGVSSSRVHTELTRVLDWEGDGHCQDGFALLRDFPPFLRIADIVRRHHLPWSDPLRASLAPDVALLANAVYLADRVDVLAKKVGHDDILLSRGAIHASIRERRGTQFAPPLVEAFLEVSDTEAFWLTLEAHHLDRWLAEASRVARPRPVEPEWLKGLAMVFARIVDAKSPFTAQHSLGVARLARHLGEMTGFDAETLDQLEIAGLLHDLGKLRVPDEILEKPAPLTDAEFAWIARHTFETYQILRRVAPFEKIAAWAGAHHETPSGEGYPFRVSGLDLTLPARIVAVADVFQALAQERSYRRALVPAEIGRVLLEMAASRRLDRDLVDLVSGQLDDIWKVAVGAKAA